MEYGKVNLKTLTNCIDSQSNSHNCISLSRVTSPKGRLCDIIAKAIARFEHF